MMTMLGAGLVFVCAFLTLTVLLLSVTSALRALFIAATRLTVAALDRAYGEIDEFIHNH